MRIVEGNYHTLDKTRVSVLCVDLEIDRPTCRVPTG